MEDYLKKEYNVYEDLKNLVKESQIEEYFLDYRDIFDCGQGYYQDEVVEICKIEDNFYSVTIKAEIGSAKQDRGDRLYWVEKIESVTYEKIDKPLPKEKQKVEYSLNLTKHQYEELEKSIDNLGIER